MQVSHIIALENAYLKKEKCNLVVLMEIIDGRHIIGIFSNEFYAKKYMSRLCLNQAIISMIDNCEEPTIKVLTSNANIVMPLSINDFEDYFNGNFDSYLLEKVNNLDPDKEIYVVQCGQFNNYMRLIGGEDVENFLTNDINIWEAKMSNKLKCHINDIYEHSELKYYTYKINPPIPKISTHINELCAKSAVINH